MKLWIIYYKRDLKRNKNFIFYMLNACKELGINAEVKIFDSLFFLKEDKNNLPDAIINRTNNYELANFFESYNVKVFNNSYLTRSANDKALCYKLMEENNIRIQKTYYDLNNFNGNYPIIVKNPLSRGGTEVYLVNNKKQLNNILQNTPKAIGQDFLKTSIAKDLRVYVINNEIVAAILRKSTTDFRANYSISHLGETYPLNEIETDLVKRIIHLFNIDYAGIDFLINDKNELIFNEIEDAVGARAIYELTNINIASLYINHIYKQTKKISCK